MKNTPPKITYASVMSREKVCLALTIVDLNGLQVKADDIMNAYVTAPITEKIWMILGFEFGAESGKKAIIVCGIYGLKSSGATF